jgi:hypothetical protein
MTDGYVEPPAREPVQPGREPGNAPEGEPGNALVTPEAERPPRREEGTVCNPDQYADGLPGPGAGSLRPPGAGVVSNPDF